MTDDQETEQRIATYTAELRAEAQLARGDLEELEDHLRCVTAELRDRGLPAAAAVTEAARRLGDPREVAREHAKQAGPFGVRPSKQRAWSAAALVAPVLAYTLAHAASRPYSVASVVECALSVLLVGALVLRQAWARALMFGTLCDVALHDVFFAVSFQGSVTLFLVLKIAAYGGAVAFLWPRSRREITRAGWGLAVTTVAYGGAATLVGLQFTEAGAVVGQRIAVAAVAAVLAGALGGLLRARWTVVPLLASAGLLVTAVVTMWGLEAKGYYPELLRITFMGSLVIAAAAALASAGIAWKSARSTLGTLRGVFA